MANPAAAPLTEDQLRQYWQDIAPAIADLDLSIDLWALLRQAWGQAPNRDSLPLTLGQTYERLAEKAAIHKRQGCYYTPTAIAQAMVEATVGRASRASNHQPPTILDPACGGGVFLVLAYRYLHQESAPLRAANGTPLLASLFGVDIDPNAVAVTRLALGLAVRLSPDSAGDNLTCLRHTICCGNTLVTGAVPARSLPPADPPFPWSNRQFSVVLGNPPYLDADAMSRHFPQWRTYCRDRFQTAKGNWDLFCVFIERALQLCEAGGWHSFVVPNKLASAEYAAPARSLLAARTIHQIWDYSRVSAFRAAVYPLAYVVRMQPVVAGHVACTAMATVEQAGATRYRCRRHFSSPQPWCLSASPQPWLSGPRGSMGDVLEVVGAASVADAYQLKPLIYNQPQGNNDFERANFKLVNSGTIDRYQHHWGQKTLRYLGDRYQHPVVSRAAIAAALPKRYRQAASPKLIIAGLTRHLECIWDAEGALLPGKSTTVILLSPTEAALGPVLLGLLNSALMTAYFQALFGGNALQGGYLRVGPPQVRSLPLPSGYPWPQGSPAVERLNRLIHQRQALTHASGARGCDALELRIEQLVRRLYDADGAMRKP